MKDKGRFDFVSVVISKLNFTCQFTPHTILKMLNIQVSEPDWSTGVKYWHDLAKRLNQPADLQKVDFLNRIIFESAGLKTKTSQSTTTVTTALVAADGKDIVNIPPIEIVSEIMSEIDDELEKTERKVDDSQTVEIKIDEKIKAFIREPV